MPQLDPTHFASQIVWVAITFVVLYLVMARLALPRISAVLEERRARRDDDNDRAAQLLDEAHAAEAQYEAALADARADAQKIIAETHAQIAAEAGQREQQLAITLSEKTAAAERRIAEAKEAAVNEIATVAVSVAQAATERLIGVAVDDSAAGAAVDAARRN